MDILLIDDEKVCGELAKASIEHEFPQFALEQVLDCQTGIGILQAKNYDAVILDLNLSGHDGLECLRTIRNEFPNMPVVILTGHCSEDRREECLNAGADYYVVKSSINHVLGMALTAAIDSRKKETEKESFVSNRRNVLNELKERNRSNGNQGHRLDGSNS